MMQAAQKYGVAGRQNEDRGFAWTANILAFLLKSLAYIRRASATGWQEKIRIDVRTRKRTQCSVAIDIVLITVYGPWSRCTIGQGDGTVYIVIHSARILYRSEPVSTCLPRTGRYGSTFPFVARPPLLSLISQPQLNSSLVNPTRN